MIRYDVLNYFSIFTFDNRTVDDCANVFTLALASSDISKYSRIYVLVKESDYEKGEYFLEIRGEREETKSEKSIRLALKKASRFNDLVKLKEQMKEFTKEELLE